MLGGILKSMWNWVYYLKTMVYWWNFSDPISYRLFQRQSIMWEKRMIDKKIYYVWVKCHKGMDILSDCFVCLKTEVS